MKGLALYFSFILIFGVYGNRGGPRGGLKKFKKYTILINWGSTLSCYSSAIFYWKILPMVGNERSYHIFFIYIDIWGIW